MAKKSGGPNKSEAIRDYVTANPNAKPREIVDALKAMGLAVSPAFVSTIKSKMGAGTGKRGRRRATSKSVTVRGRRPAAPTAAKAVSSSLLDDLITAKQLADKLGGIDKAKAALEALAKITG